MNKQWAATIVDQAGNQVGMTSYYATKDEARDGMKDLLRAAPIGSKCYLMKATAYVETLITFNVVNI